MNYQLFTQDSHDSIRWSYTKKKIYQVANLWQGGLSYNEIALEAHLKKVEVMLILIDLAEDKQLDGRIGGIYGAEAMKNKKKIGAIF